MFTRSSRILVVSLLITLIAAAGCAKRPATTAASAPAPMGAATSTTPPAMAPAPAPAPTAAPMAPPAASAVPATPPAGAAPARPSPREFVAIADLKDINFDFDKYDIRPADAKTLDANAAWLKSNTEQLVLIEGHCDERGTNEYNLALGERRAKSTMNYLVSQGVQASRITIISYGEERPLCTEHTEQCWAKNRRSHFLVKPR